MKIGYFKKEHLLAKLANVSEESLKSIECQKIELITTDLTKIANALNVDVDLLLDSTMSMDNQDMYWLRNILQNHKTEIDFSQLQKQIMNLINIYSSSSNAFCKSALTVLSSLKSLTTISRLFSFKTTSSGTSKKSLIASSPIKAFTPFSRISR